jgi:hypothetical protein
MSMTLRSTIPTRSLSALALVVALVSSGCDDGFTQPSPPENLKIDYDSRLQPGAFSWRSMVVEKAGTVQVHLTGISPNNEAVVALGFGRFENNGCTITNAVETAPGNTAQISVPGVQPGSYCVRVADVGNLTSDWQFFIDIIFPNPDA